MFAEGHLAHSSTHLFTHSTSMYSTGQHLELLGLMVHLVHSVKNVHRTSMSQVPAYGGEKGGRGSRCHGPLRGLDEGGWQP